MSIDTIPSLDRVTGQSTGAAKPYPDTPFLSAVPTGSDDAVPEFIRKMKRPTLPLANQVNPDTEPVVTLGQAILDGTMERGKAQLISEVTHLRETLAKRYPVMGIFRRLISGLIGVQDTRPVLHELGTMRDQGAKTLLSLGDQINHNTMVVKELGDWMTTLDHAIQSRNERDELRAKVDILNRTLREERGHIELIKKEAADWHAATKAEHEKELNEQNRTRRGIEAEWEADRLRQGDRIEELCAHIDNLEERFARIAKFSSLVTLQKAFIAATTAKTPKAVQTALNKLEQAQLDVEQLVTTHPFIAEATEQPATPEA